MRLFVAVSVPEEVSALLASLDRPDERDLRWTTPGQWHVTLRFIGHHDEARQVATALDAMAWAEPVQARMGPATAWFPGRRVLQVPVAGLDELAVAVRDATAGFGDPPENPFRGHLTLARVRGRRPGRQALAGTPLEAMWQVRDLALFSSTPGRGGSRYDVLHRVPLPA